MKNVKTFFSMFRKLIRILDRKQKRQGIILFFLMLIVSLLEMLGVGVIVPFVLTMLEPEKIMGNRFIAPLVAELGITEYKQFMYLIGISIVIIYFVKNGFILLVNYYQSNYRNQLEKVLNVKMLSSYMKRPYIFFVNTNSADILRGVNSDIMNVASAVDGFSNIFSEGLTCLIIGTFLISLNPFMAISLLSIVGITAIAIVLKFKKKVGVCGEQTREAFADKLKRINHAVNGIKEIVVADRKSYFVDEFEAAAQKAAVSNTKYLWISKTPSRLIEVIFIGGLITIVTASYQETGSNVEFITQLSAMGIAAVRILPSISSLAGGINSLVYLRPSLEAAYENLSEADKYGAELKDEKKERDFSFKESILINHISWRYRTGLPWVLEDLCMEIHKGDAVALIGESGAGKSTLADILLGLFQPESGMIEVDGRDIRQMGGFWSEMIGYVPQTVFLTDDSIRKNVAFGIPDEEIDDFKVWKALELAQIDDTVKKMEHGLDSLAGERGISLSGGQRQRISIARALYHNPDILILDEATSALDSDTEDAIMKTIEVLQGKKTLIIIAHRLTTIRNCNRIYEIRGGKAVLRTHREVFA